MTAATLRVGPNSALLALDRALASLGVAPRPPLADDQCELERDGHRTVCRVLVPLTRTVRVDLCGVAITVPRDGTAGEHGYRIARMG